MNTADLLGIIGNQWLGSGFPVMVENDRLRLEAASLAFYISIVPGDEEDAMLGEGFYLECNDAVRRLRTPDDSESVLGCCLAYLSNDDRARKAMTDLHIDGGRISRCVFTLEGECKVLKVEPA